MYTTRWIWASAAVVLLATPALAQGEGKRGFCVDYANEAVEMQKRNIALGCGIKGLRWHDWWDGHYGWCMDWVGPDEVREHAKLRRVEMSRCEDVEEPRQSRYDRDEKRRY